MNARLERTNLSEQVAAAVVSAVLNGTYSQGSLLPAEPELARRFGVSRPVIREAIRILATKGVVRSEHGRGVIVLGYSSQPLLDGLALSAPRLRISARDVWETRFMIDVGIAEATALRRTEADLVQMRTILERMREEITTSGAFVPDTDAEFHRALVAAAHNEFVSLLIEPVAYLNREIARAVRERVVGVDSARSTSSWMESSYAVHQRIYEMVASGDANGTRAALREHWDLAFSVWGLQLEIAVGDLLPLWPLPTSA